MIYATGLQRLSAFKAGAELVRCLQEAKVAAREEEEMMLEKPPEHHKQANIQGVPPEISNAVCRYCREQIGHDAYVSCVNSAAFGAPLPPATTFVHRVCFEEAKTLIIPGSEVRVDLPGDKFHGKVLATVLFFFLRVLACAYACTGLASSAPFLLPSMHLPSRSLSPASFIHVSHSLATSLLPSFFLPIQH